jgi:hypothetical protein
MKRMCAGMGFLIQTATVSATPPDSTAIAHTKMIAFLEAMKASTSTEFHHVINGSGG